ncbi:MULTISPECIES: diaminobutyrate acetyltransferase [Sporosarcina]|uniref:diaminobutyrate acetyltransferase n=1 Tax=Sporosarcina TaxID=1569 RepID=UPI00129ACDAF|nr:MULTISPECIES: diaminobutyrate acetyltransferase [Sporosarcina]GKV64432.1 L-2,4-diaminobutyric acid acetyltransferase [Sporosarcina sp. NCCP-2331]GLB55177.1 L-2,4-diaminobutyric acid acetyltransferase [Sporosarcina sp. NCCP-2378]
MQKHHKYSIAGYDPNDPYSFRTPTVKDGKWIWQLVKDTGVLDVNSPYSYLLWADQFSETSIVVEDHGKVVGFISGFIQPKAPDTLFIWQVAVDESARGQGLASRMLHAILQRPVCRIVQYLEATVTPTNIPSTKLFKGLARDLQTECAVSEGYTAGHFPGGEHEAEELFRIGPF